VETEPAIIKTYVATGKVKLVYRHLLQLGDVSVRASEASECAADQGKFWEMRGLLYERQRDLYDASRLDATLDAFAQELGLDTAAFGECMQSHKHLELVQADYQAAQAEGIRARPTFDINGERLVGAQPFAVFEQLIEGQVNNP
jgi:protein-disulfide isomerase